MSKATVKPKPGAERRSGQDRRRVEGSPPGRHERRRKAEARQPDVTELDMTSSEWMALNQQFVPPAPPKKKP